MLGVVGYLGIWWQNMITVACKIDAFQQRWSNIGVGYQRIMFGYAGTEIHHRLRRIHVLNLFAQDKSIGMCSRKQRAPSTWPVSLATVSHGLDLEGAQGVPPIASRPSYACRLTRRRGFVWLLFDFSPFSGFQLGRPTTAGRSHRADDGLGITPESADETM